VRNEDIRFCDECGGALNGGTGSPLAGATVKVQRLVINRSNARNEAAMMAMLPGAPGIVGVFSTGDLLEEPPELYGSVLLCQPCLMKPLGVMHLVELAAATEERLNREHMRGGPAPR
jgi:hypothetical protein